jgi:hypothetical protein
MERKTILLSMTRFSMFIVLLTETYFDEKCEVSSLVAIPRQKWLPERATVLRYTYIAFIVGMFVDRKLGIYSTFCSGGMAYHVDS